MPAVNNYFFGGTKMKKSMVVMLTAALTLTVLVAGCSKKEEAAVTKDGAAAKLQISIATVIPPNTPVTLGLDNYSQALNETGIFDTAVFPGSQLGSLVDVMDRCLAGDPVIMTCDPADLADVTIKDLSIAQAPFLFETWDQVDKLTASSWWKELTGQVEQKGMKIIAYNWAFGERHILTKTPVRQLSDLSGKKIRVPSNVNFVRSFEALGAAPTPMALGEVFTSLQQGTIDGLENPYSDIYANKFHEAGKYIIEDDHIKQICLIICGTDFYNTLTAGQQNTLVELARTSGIFQRDLLLKGNDEVKARLTSEGVTFTQINRDEFVSAIEKNYYPRFTDWTPGLRDTVLAVLNN
jgi:TRAP-type C4-dicarboxylate transport system substrate-binding protein